MWFKQVQVHMKLAYSTCSKSTPHQISFVRSMLEALAKCSMLEALAKHLPSALEEPRLQVHCTRLQLHRLNLLLLLLLP
jgi:hypothetical protein